MEKNNYVSFEIEGAIEKENFSRFWEELKKLKNPTYLVKNDEFEDIKIRKYLSEELKNKENSNILKSDKTIRNPSGTYKVEFVMQKYNLFDKQTKNELKKVCKIFDNYGEECEKSGTHINFDARSFMPYISEIYLQNKDSFDFDEDFRKEIPDEIVELIEYQPFGQNITSILMKNKTFSINFEPIESEGRVEIRTFNSNCEGRKKLLEFFDSSKKIIIEGKKEYNLFCFDQYDFERIRKKKKLNEIIFGCTGNTLITNNIYRNFYHFMTEHKKEEEFTIKKMLSAKYEIYDKYLK